METVLTYIGSIASIGGIPLAIYLYLKSREDKIDKIRRQVLQIISYQIGEKRDLKIFEIEKVINSNVRNNKLAIGSITASNIIEDLISDTIASPLLDPERKNQIIDNLQKIFPSENLSISSPSSSSQSTLFASVALVMSLLPIFITLVIGKDGWSENLDWWFSFNAFKGYVPNVIFSVVTAGSGLLASYMILKLKSSTKKTSHNKSSKRDAEKTGAPS